MFDPDPLIWITSKENDEGIEGRVLGESFTDLEDYSKV